MARSRQLPDKKEEVPQAAHLTVSQDMVLFLQSREIRTLDDVLDLQKMLLAEVLMGNIPLVASERIRKWAELMMATAAAKAPRGTTINNVGNLTAIEQFLQIEQTGRQAIAEQPQYKQLAEPVPMIIDLPQIEQAPELELIFDDS